MTEKKPFLRKNFIKIVSLIVYIAAGTLAVDKYIAERKLIPRIIFPYTDMVHKQSEKELQNLETLASQSQEGKTFTAPHLNRKGYMVNAGGYIVSSLEEYEIWYNLGFPDFSHERIISGMRKGFRFDKYLIVGDVGGSYGRAAYELQQMEGVEAFVIDPDTTLLPEGEGLPRNRFINSKIEETGLPDESFHFITSNLTYEFTEIPTSFVETHRLLKDRGLAVIQLSNWEEKGILDKINSSNINDDVYVAYRIWEFESPPKLTDNYVLFKPIQDFINYYKERSGSPLFPMFVIEK